MFFRKKVLALVISSSLLLAACDSGGSASGSSSVAGTVTKGPVHGAVVNIYRVDSDGTRGALVAGPFEVSSGSWEGDIPSNVSGPLMLVATGGSYIDEATGSTVTIDAGDEMISIVSSAKATMPITPYTHVMAAAMQQIVANGSALSETVKAVTQNAITQFGFNPTEVKPVNWKNIPSDASEAEKQYAALLGGLSQLAQNASVQSVAGSANPFDIAIALASDMVDGKLDGNNAGVAVSFATPSGTVNLPQLGNDLSLLLSQAAVFVNANAGFANVTLPSTISGFYAVPTTGGTTANCNSACQQFFTTYGGQVLQFTPDTSLARDALVAEFDGATTYKVTISSSGLLMVDADAMQFEFAASEITMFEDVSHETNVIYTDSATGYRVIFQRSKSDGKLMVNISEPYATGADINTLDNATLYYTPTTTDPVPSSLVAVGDGSALAGSNGATGTIGAKTYTYTGTIGGGEMYIFAPLTSVGLFMSHDGSDPITRWTISGLTNSVGTYSCGANGSSPSISLTLSGVPYLADDCSIELISVSATEVEGRFAAHFNDGSGNDFGTVTDGYFRYEIPTTGGGTSLGAGEYGYSMDVDGQNVTVTGLPALDGFDRQVAGFLTLGDTPTFQIRMIPDATVGTYTCGQGPNSFRLVGMSYGGGTSENSTGSCTVNVTSAGPIYEGTYSATLYTNAGAAIQITNGFFRNDGSQL